MSRFGEEMIGGLIVGGRPFRVDVVLGMSRWQVKIDTNDNWLFASETDVDQMVELLHRAKTRVAELNKALERTFR